MNNLLLSSSRLAQPRRTGRVVRPLPNVCCEELLVLDVNTSVLATWYAVDGYIMCAPLYCNTCALCKWGPNFLKYGVWPVKPEWRVVSLLRLQTVSDCIPHPYWMYEKCFSTLICYGDGLMGAPLHCGVSFMIIGIGRDWTQMTLCGVSIEAASSLSQTASHIHIECIQSVLAPWYAMVLEESARVNPDARIRPLSKASVDRAHLAESIGSNSFN